jgi:ribulose-phosphate 3-epimerase
MSSAIEIIPTSVPHSKDEFADSARVIYGFTQNIHLDVADGIFAHEVTWPYIKFKEVGAFDLSQIHMQIEAHLMVEEPQALAMRFYEQGVRQIIMHAEPFHNKDEIMRAIEPLKTRGTKIGLAFLIDTPLDVLSVIGAECDFVHLMTIAAIGRQGIMYDKRGVDRVREVHKRFPQLVISVDGGVNETNIAELAKAGARRFCVGHAIMSSSDPVAEYTKLKSIAETAVI